jgi:DNA-binding MarR family transcriptional regulator
MQAFCRMARVPKLDPSDPTGEFPIEPAAYFLHLMLIVDRYRDARIEQLLRPMNISLDAHRAIRIIHSRGSCTMGELADYAIIDRTTLTRIVDQLVASGLVDRAKPPGDRRKIVLTLTPAGVESHAQARGLIGRDNAELTRGLLESDFRTGVRLEQELVRRLVADPEMAHRLLWGIGAAPAPSTSITKGSAAAPER